MDDIIRTGIVMDVNVGQKRARVKFADDYSGWLYVLQHTGVWGRAEPANGHSHDVALGEWMPKVNDRVLAAFLPCPDGDGFILGVI